MNEDLTLNDKDLNVFGQFRYYQIAIFASCILFPAWGFVLSGKLGNFDPPLIRVAIAMPLLIINLLSFKISFLHKNLKNIFYVFISIAIIHHHVFLHLNKISMDYVVGGLIFLFIVSNIILEAKFKLGISMMFVGLTYLVCFNHLGIDAIDTERNSSVMLMGVTTVGIFTYLNYLNHMKVQSMFISEVNENSSLRRWSSVGQMAGGIAHEVNTPLTTMSLVLENLMSKLEKNEIESAKKDVSQLIRIGEKIGNIVHSLRLLTVTGGKFERDKVSLFDVMTQAKNEFAEKCKAKNIAFSYMYNIESSGKVWGSGPALNQVLINLIKNAIEAVEKLDEKWVKLLLIENSTHYKILVQNSGPPIDAATAERLFEPFYTTKDIGTAMGIGLSISRTIVTAHGGRIRVDNVYPHVVFEVQIPKIKEEIQKTRIGKAA